MSGNIRLARQAPVSACQDLLHIDPILVGLDDDLLAVMRRAADQPATRLIGVVDAAGVLVGVIPIVRLAESVIARVVPEALMTGIEDIADVERFGTTLEARTAREAMLAPSTIRPEATIDDAFRLMHARRLSGLYVIDDDGRPTGYVDLLELAILYVEAIEAGTPPPSS